MLTFHILTLFPNSFSYLDESMLARAVKHKKISVKIYDIRDFAEGKPQGPHGRGKHKDADDKPYGGGPGMVLKAEPILRAVQSIRSKVKGQRPKVILLAADGKLFTNPYAKKLSNIHKNIILIAGHYEGVDERVAKILKAEKISIGPYILTGGELPAMVVLDAVARQIQGVLGKHESLEESREASSEVYTRPETIIHKKKKYAVPKVLLSGNHKKINEWRGRKNKLIA